VRKHNKSEKKPAMAAQCSKASMLAALVLSLRSTYRQPANQSQCNGRVSAMKERGAIALSHPKLLGPLIAMRENIISHSQSPFNAENMLVADHAVVFES